jgi:ABC-type lipoprotein release transport system permease subunit
LSLSLESLVFGISAGNWTTTMAVGFAMVAIMMLAAWMPTRRAARLEPVHALRIQ